MCCDVKDVGLLVVSGLMQQIFHADCFEDPGRCGLQIVQENTADRFRTIQLLPVSGDIQSQMVADARLQEQQRNGSGAVGKSDGIRDFSILERDAGKKR